MFRKMCVPLLLGALLLGAGLWAWPRYRMWAAYNKLMAMPRMHQAVENVAFLMDGLDDDPPHGEKQTVLSFPGFSIALPMGGELITTAPLPCSPGYRIGHPSGSVVVTLSDDSIQTSATAELSQEEKTFARDLESSLLGLTIADPPLTPQEFLYAPLGQLQDRLSSVVSKAAAFSGVERIETFATSTSTLSTQH